MKKQIKKPLKSGGTFITDSNFNVILFTEKQALARTKQFKRKLEKGFTNNFKFKHCSIKDRGNYFSQCMA